MLRFSNISALGAPAFDPGTLSGLGRGVSKPILSPRPQIGGSVPMNYPTLKGRPILGSFKKGGKVKKTGLYQLHKGEKVTPLRAKVKATMGKKAC